MQNKKLVCAAETLLDVQYGYAQKGIALSQAALCGARDFIAWQHYPRNDLADATSGDEFYYHAHDADEMPKAEHGHFHVFKRDLKNPARFFHLIGIALNNQGLPVRLFTTNQWVTGERIVDAKKIQRAVAAFSVHSTGRTAPLARWVTAMMQLYAVEIVSLAQQRDAVIALHTGTATTTNTTTTTTTTTAAAAAAATATATATAKAKATTTHTATERKQFLEDRAHHVLSACPIDLVPRLAQYLPG